NGRLDLNIARRRVLGVIAQQVRVGKVSNYRRNDDCDTDKPCVGTDDAPDVGAGHLGGSRGVRGKGRAVAIGRRHGGRPGKTSGAGLGQRRHVSTYSWDNTATRGSNRYQGLAKPYGKKVGIVGLKCILTRSRQIVELFTRLWDVRSPGWGAR